MRGMKTGLAAVMVLVLLLAALAACSSKGTTEAESAPSAAADRTAAAPLDPVTLKIVIPGDRPADMDTVLAEAERRMKDTVNVKLDVVFVPWADVQAKTQLMLSTGEAIDLMFDAPWNNMEQMIAGGYYEPLDDLLNTYGPNVLATQSQLTWDANKRNGKIMAIPLGVSNFQGFSFVMRSDILEQLGNPPLNSYEDVIELAYTVKEKYPDLVPYVPHTEYPATFRALDKSALDGWTNAQRLVLHYVLYRVGNNGKILNLFDEMLPEFWDGVLEARKLYQDKIIYQDVMSDKEKNSLGNNGKAFMMDYNAFEATASDQLALSNNVPGATWTSVIFFELTPKKYTSTFAQANFIAVPKASKNKERAIRFLNWVHESQANYDLLAYGIEGVNWEPVGERQYKPLTPDKYPWFPYGWIWNPKYDRLNSDLDEEQLKYYDFTYNADNFEKDALTGFAFDTTAVQNEIAQFNTLVSTYYIPIMYGILEPEKAWEELKREGYASVKKVQEEMQKQIDAFLQSQPQ